MSQSPHFSIVNLGIPCQKTQEAILILEESRDRLCQNEDQTYEKALTSAPIKDWPLVPGILVGFAVHYRDGS